jgi:hypothetical protein
MLVPLDHGKHAPIKFGTLKGKIWIADNFDDPLPDDVLDEFGCWSPKQSPNRCDS